MNTLIISWLKLREHAGHPSNWVIYLLMPLLIILILGTALSGQFEDDNEISMNIAVVSKDPSRLLNDLTTMNIPGVIITNSDDQEHDVLFSINENTRQILIKSDSAGTGKIARSILKNAAAWSCLNDLDLQDVPFFPTDHDFTNLKSLSSGHKPRVIDYYGVTMLTMFILYGAYFSAYGLIDERRRGTLQRIAVSPVKGHSILTGIALGTISTSIIQGCIIIGTASLVYGVYYGNSPLLLSAVLLAEAVFAMSLGLWIANTVKSSKAVDQGLNIMVLVMVFLGGGFVTMPEVGILSVLSRISPVHWLNKAVFAVIYNGNNSSIISAIVILSGLSIIMLIHGSWIFLTREVK